MKLKKAMALPLLKTWKKSTIGFRRHHDELFSWEEGCDCRFGLIKNFDQIQKYKSILIWSLVVSFYMLNK